MEHPAPSLALKIRARSPGTTRNGPESWSSKTPSTDMTSLRTDTMRNTIEMKKPIAAGRPTGGHLKDLRSCLAVLSNVVSSEFNQWLTQATSLFSDDIQVVLRQPPRELSHAHDDPTGLPPHSDRVRHMAYENERRTRRRLQGIEETPASAMFGSPHHADLMADAPSYAAPGGCNLD